jgi:hypothetical protein
MNPTIKAREKYLSVVPPNKKIAIRGKRVVKVVLIDRPKV